MEFNQMESNQMGVNQMEPKLIAFNPRPLPLTEVFFFLHRCRFDPHKQTARIAFTRGVVTVK